MMGRAPADLRRVARVVIDDPDSMTAYRRDQCVGADAGVPLAVVLAESVDEVSSTLRWANDRGVPVVTRGAGTGLAGGANALDGCLVLSVARLDAILELDAAARTARVQPGVLNGDLDRAAAEQELWYVPDPGSKAISSIGGNIATNAGGMCCAKYGVTRDHVLALSVALADGEVIRTGGASRKNVVGLDLTSLLIGSEGTLGVIVEATVRLRQRRSGTSTVAAAFASANHAVETTAALPPDVEPQAMELLDRTTVRAVNELTRMDLDEHAGALVLARFDGGDRAWQAATFAASADAAGADVFSTTDEQEGHALMEARRLALPALEARGATLLDDVAVVTSRLPALLDEIDRIAARNRVVVGTFGHVLDGNLHPTIVYDPADAAQAARARAAFTEILHAALDLGGTMSGEHGVGSLKTAFVDHQLGLTERRLMHGVKSVFDPAGILNPGRAY